MAVLHWFYCIYLHWSKIWDWIHLNIYEPDNELSVLSSGQPHIKSSKLENRHCNRLQYLTRKNQKYALIPDNLFGMKIAVMRQLIALEVL